MTWNEIVSLTSLDFIEIALINPIRKGDEYKTGKLIGFKASNKKNPPRVQIKYGVYKMCPQPKTICDWVDVTNCTFDLIKNK